MDLNAHAGGAPGRGRAAPPARLWLAAGLVWAAAVGTGFAVLLRYSNTPAGEQGAHPRRWPAASGIARGADRATLVMFAHPHCPCTRASLAELARLMARFEGRLSGYVLVVEPQGAAEGFAADGLAERAAGIAGVTALADRGGVEAARFGAATSGLTLLYDARGRLVFSGGLTAARGHEGQSFGQRRIASLLTTGAADRADAPVFGCSLLDSRGRTAS